MNNQYWKVTGEIAAYTPGSPVSYCHYVADIAVVEETVLIQSVLFSHNIIILR